MRFVFKYLKGLKINKQNNLSLMLAIKCENICHLIASISHKCNMNKATFVLVPFLNSVGRL